jgi:hypothetical protein
MPSLILSIALFLGSSRSSRHWLYGNAHLKSTLSVLPARRQSITPAASYELQRRFEANGAEAIAVAAHPGGANTNLQDEIGERWYAKTLVPLMRRMMQSAAMGTLPIIRAAVDPNAKGGQYYFPVQGLRWTAQPVFFKSCLRRLCTGKASGYFHRTEQASSIQGLVNLPLGKELITTNTTVTKLNP